MKQIHIFFKCVILNFVTNLAKIEGVGIFIKQGIKYKVIEKLTTAVEGLFECIYVELSHYRKVIVSCVYRQPGSSIEEFTNCIENMSITLNWSLYLSGDLNINLLNYDNHSGSEFLVDQLFTMSLFPQINKPTSIVHDCYSIIDNIFTNVLHEKMHCGILIDHTSDHLPVLYITGHEVKRKPKNVFFIERRIMNA